MHTALSKGMFLYPWDVSQEGAREVVRSLQTIGCNAAVVTSSYHQGRFFHPRSQTFRRLPHSGIFFQPDLTRYKLLRPMVHAELSSQNILAEIKNECEQEGLSFQTWWVGLHNSTLGQMHPDHCVRNVWGDRYTYSLCPSQPEVQHYAKALFADTLEQVQPERILVEATAFLPMQHGEHHEVSLLRWGESLQWLLSLCFCDACEERANRQGVDVKALKDLVARLVKQMIEADLAHVPAETREIAFLLLEFPELYQYQLTRMQTVGELWHELKEIALEHQVKMDGFPSSTPFPVNQSYLEGISLRTAIAELDRVIPLAYGDSVDAVRYALHAIRLAAPEASLGVALSLHHTQIQSAAELGMRVRTAVEAGVESIIYYNYGLLNQRRLDWIAEANQTAEELERRA
jgi:hypothetical protein